MYLNSNGLLALVCIVLHISIDDAEIEITVVLIKLGNPLQILIEFFLAKLVTFGHPSKQTTLAQAHLFNQTPV